MFKINMWLVLLFNNLAWLNIVIACHYNFWEKDAPGIVMYVFFLGCICALAFIGCILSVAEEQDQKANISEKPNSWVVVVAKNTHTKKVRAKNSK